MAKFGLPGGGRRTKQPQYPVRVDQSNPLSKGLIVTVNPPSGEIITSVQPAYYGSAAKSPRNNRQAYVSSSTTADAVAFALAAAHPLYSITTDFTLSLWIEPTSDADYANYFSVPYRASGWTSPYNSLVVYKHTGELNKTSLQWAISSTVTNSLLFSTAIITVAAASYANYIFTRSGSTCSAYKNGVLVESGTATGNGAIDWGEKRPIVLLNSTDSSLPNGGYIGYQDGLDIWNRALSADEIARDYARRYQILEPLKRNIYVEAAASGAQTLTPSLYTDGDTFYTPTVAPGPVALTPGLYADADTFYAPLVSHGLTAGLFTDADTFYAPTVAPGSVGLTPGLYSDADTFYAATVVVEGGTQTLLPALYAEPDTFYAATVSPGSVALTPALYVDADTFYAASVVVATTQTLTPALYDDPDTFYAAAVTDGSADTHDGFLQPVKRQKRSKEVRRELERLFDKAEVVIEKITAPKEALKEVPKEVRSNTVDIGLPPLNELQMVLMHLQLIQDQMTAQQIQHLTELQAQMDWSRMYNIRARAALLAA